jgi:ubiquinone/menaquinone biosynthesis C-methylase UbiE
MPLVGSQRKRREAEQFYKLAEKTAYRNYTVRVRDCGWATQRCLTDEHFGNLTRKLAQISGITGHRIERGISPAFHWSRRYEYPYAIMNTEPGEDVKGFKVLDCGAGLNPVQFYLAMKGYEVYSLDRDLSALEKVARFKSKTRLSALHPTYGNIIGLPFPCEYFDRVLCISVLEHVLENAPSDIDTDIVLKACVNELLRVAKPGGLVIVTVDVNVNSQSSPRRLYFHEYESLCRILGVSPTHPPKERLCSSDTEEGRVMGENLCAYCVTFTHEQLALSTANPCI